MLNNLGACTSPAKKENSKDLRLCVVGGHFGLRFQNLNLCRMENKKKNIFQVVVLTCVVISFLICLRTEIWHHRVLEVPFSTA